MSAFTSILLACATVTVYAQQQVAVPWSGSVNFTSPSYPRKYDVGKQLSYIFTSDDADHGIAFDVVILDLDSAEDILVFTEEIPGFGSAIIGKLQHAKTSIGKPSTDKYRIRSSTNSVRVLFTTDYQGHNAATGFLISVSTDVLGSKTSVTGVCAKGKNTFTVSGKDSLSRPGECSQERLVAKLTVDQTRGCREELYAAHKWIVGKLPGSGSTGRLRSVPPVAVTCRDGTLKVSDVEPDESQAVELTFIATADAKCRDLFLEFLTAIKFSPAAGKLI